MDDNKYYDDICRLCTDKNAGIDIFSDDEKPYDLSRLIRKYLYISVSKLNTFPLFSPPVRAITVMFTDQGMLQYLFLSWGLGYEASRVQWRSSHFYLIDDFINRRIMLSYYQYKVLNKYRFNIICFTASLNVWVKFIEYPNVITWLLDSNLFYRTVI